MPEARVNDWVHAAPKESVDNWPLAITISDALGGTPVYRYPSSGVTGDGEPPLETDMRKFEGRLDSSFFGGLRLGEFGRGNWMAGRRFEGLAPREEPTAG